MPMCNRVEKIHLLPTRAPDAGSFRCIFPFRVRVHKKGVSPKQHAFVSDSFRLQFFISMVILTLNKRKELKKTDISVKLNKNNPKKEAQISMYYHPLLLRCMSQPFLPLTTTAYQACQEASPIPLTLATFQGTSTPCLWLPNACHTLIYNLTQDNSFDIPSTNTPKELIFEKDCIYFSITFFPGILPSDLLKNTPILIHALSVSSLFSAQISCVVSTLTPDSIRIPPFSVQQMITAIAASHGSLSIHQLAQNLSYSERHIRRLFESYINYPPKTLNRILRFQSSLQEILKMSDRNNSEFIHLLSYSDQAHFQREFKAFTTMTPRHFIQLLQNLSLQYWTQKS